MKVLSVMNGDYYRKAQLFKLDRTKYPVAPSPLHTYYILNPETWAPNISFKSLKDCKKEV